MTTITFDPLRALELRRSEENRVSRNSGGEQSVSGVFTTSGWGEFLAGPPLVFGTTFLEMPAVAFGSILGVGALVPGRYPRCSGFVLRWDTTARGHYVGAWVAVTVDPGYPLAADAGYTLTHTFAFTGLALRVIPDAVVGEF